MAGVNYVDHVVDAFAHMGTPLSKADVYANTRKGSPQLFWAVARPVVGCDARIEIPSRANGLFDYEGEAAVVLGRRGKDLKLADCKSFVWGVTQVIDWSVREEGWPPKPPNPFLWTKNFDGSKSIGPCIAVDEIDIQDFQLQTWVSGELRQDHNTRDMIFSFAELLEFASKDLTLYPGDVLSGGTGAGTAVDRTIPNKNGSWPRDGYLKPGDTVEVRSTIGSLVGHVVAKSTAARGSA
jgi:2-keto-4-pentenoate hydratase/2-oxohepta-3-ene-1,7-dioic acid hydratase in catechol pathway